MLVLGSILVDLSQFHIGTLFRYLLFCHTCFTCLFHLSEIIQLVESMSSGYVFIVCVFEQLNDLI